MASRVTYRALFDDKLVALEDEGYGDFEFEESEKDTYLDLAVARLYPAVYQRVALEGESITSYGTGVYGEVETDYADRVFLVEDATERDIVVGWKYRPGRIIGLDMLAVSSVNLYYHDAYVLPADEDDDAGIPTIYTPLVVLGALIEALESRHDTGLRGDPPPTGDHKEVSLLDRLIARYDRAKEDLAMGLPAVML